MLSVLCKYRYIEASVKVHRTEYELACAFFSPWCNYFIMLIGTAVFMFIRTNLSDELNTATISQHRFFKRQNLKNQARNLGVIMDSDLNFSSHTTTTAKSTYYHLKNISRIKGLMPLQDSEKFVHALQDSLKNPSDSCS